MLYTYKTSISLYALKFYSNNNILILSVNFFQGSKCKCTKAINPARFLPWHSTSGGRGDMSYWTYDGSLTTPPLFETVTWIVFKKPMAVSKEQLDIMRNLKCNSPCSGHRTFANFNPNEDIPMIDNYRPPQPINDRIVRQIKL